MQIRLDLKTAFTLQLPCAPVSFLTSLPMMRVNPPVSPRLLLLLACLCAQVLAVRAAAAQESSDVWIPYSGLNLYPECADYGANSSPGGMAAGPSSWLGNLWNPHGDWVWTFLPQGFLYHTYWASEAEPRLSSQIFSESNQGTLLDSTIGGRLGFVRFGKRYGEEGWQLDVLAGAKLRQSVDNNMDMVATDYRFDLPFTYRYGQHALKFGYYHVSSHTGDEFLLSHPGFNRLNYYRNALYLGYSYYVIPELRLYGEADYGFDTDIAQPWNFQFGLDFGPARPTGIRGAPFFAINGHLQQELNYGGSVNIQCGWAWKGEGLAAGVGRLGPYYYNGGSPQYSFYNVSEQQIGVGVWYDY